MVGGVAPEGAVHHRHRSGAAPTIVPDTTAKASRCVAAEGAVGDCQRRDAARTTVEDTAAAGVVGISGAVSLAYDSPDVEASVGSGMDIDASGTVRVAATNNSRAVATSAGLAERSSVFVSISYPRTA